MGKYINLVKNWRGQSVYVKWLIKYTKPYFHKLLFLMGLNTLNSLTSIALALISKKIIDNASAGLAIKNGIFLYAVVIIVSMLIGIFFTIMSALINERFAFSIRSKIYDSVLHTCWPNISKYHSGDVITRLTSDIDIIANGISGIIPSILSLFTTFISAFITLAYFDKGFALFALIIGPFAAVVSIVLGRKMRRIQEKVQQSESAYKSSFQETVSNMLVVKAFEGQDYAGNRLLQLRDQRLFWMRKRQYLSAGSGAALSGVFQFGYLAAFAWSSFRLSTGAITYGTVGIFLNMIGQIQGPMLGLSQLIPQFVMILTSTERVMELENLPLEASGAPDIADGPVTLSINNVNFGYTNETVLENACIDIKAGEFVALMGSSGIGKTTFLRLVMAYFKPSGGNIKITDSEGNAFEITEGLRKYMSYVPQGNTLMSGTIAENLRFGRLDATEEEMWDVLKVVKAEAFVRETPNGLYTVIGERGLGLSEGQAQRIAIARALIRRAPLLILDEATSALDENTEAAVLEHLKNALPRPTCIIVTHRVSILQYCERSFKIEDKTIQERE